MPAHRIFATPFAVVYPQDVKSAERKGRSKEEVDQVICWLTGDDRAGQQRTLHRRFGHIGPAGLFWRPYGAK